ncbi:MAG: hypothetical protein R2911_05545 [Caldilineaceae bacterium]
MKTLFIIISVLFGLGAVAWAGLQIKPAPFPAYGVSSAIPETIPLPDDLPAPVERFYRQVYGGACR